MKVSEEFMQMYFSEFGRLEKSKVNKEIVEGFSQKFLFNIAMKCE